MFFITSGALLLLAGIGSWGQPEWFNDLAKEDQLLENLTTGLLAGTVCLGLWLQRCQRTHKPAIRGFTTIALLGFLDEISFGERLFNLKMPKAGGTQIDGLHDLLNMTKKIVITNANFHPIATTVTLAVIAGGLIATASWNRTSIVQFIEYSSTTKTFSTIAITALAVFISQTLDLEDFGWTAAKALEETLELIAAMGLATCLITWSNKNVSATDSL